MAQARASTTQQRREEVHAASQYAASLHCLLAILKNLSRSRRGSGFVDTKEELRSIAWSGVRLRANTVA